MNKERERPTTPLRGAIRLHYRDVVALLNFMDEVIEEEKLNTFVPVNNSKNYKPLSDEEQHAYERLKDMKVQMEDFFRWSEGQKGRGK